MSNVPKIVLKKENIAIALLDKFCIKNNENINFDVFSKA